MAKVHHLFVFRKRCMDLVSFETQQEYDWVKGFINGELKINPTQKLKLTNADASQAMFLTSGPPVVSVTLTVATGRTSSRRTSTAGSGRRTRLVSVQPTVPPSTTGPALEVSAPRDLSQTTENRFSRLVTFPCPGHESLGSYDAITFNEFGYFTARSEFSGYRNICRTVRQSPAWQC